VFPPFEDVVREKPISPHHLAYLFPVLKHFSENLYFFLGGIFFSSAHLYLLGAPSEMAIVYHLICFSLNRQVQRGQNILTIEQLIEILPEPLLELFLFVNCL
jgi:hypothetical protein